LEKYRHDIIGLQNELQRVETMATHKTNEQTITKKRYAEVLDEMSLVDRELGTLRD